MKKILSLVVLAAVASLIPTASLACDGEGKTKHKAHKAEAKQKSGDCGDKCDAKAKAEGCGDEGCSDKAKAEEPKTTDKAAAPAESTGKEASAPAGEKAEAKTEAKTEATEAKTEAPAEQAANPPAQ